MVATARAHQLADPPRDIPPGMVLKVLATSGVKKSLIGFVPAALALFHVVKLDTGPRVALLAITAVFLLIGVVMASAALARAARTLHMMRHGFLAEGKIVSCRLASEKKESPYADFLATWTVHVTRPQARVIQGFKWMIVGWFVGMFGLFALIAGVMLVLNSQRQRPDADVTLALWLWLGTAAAFALYIFWMVRSSRRRAAKEDAAAPAPAPINDPLPPASYAGIALYCTVEYPVQGVRRAGRGRVLLSSRLDRAGTAPLLYPANGHGNVVFLAGLPAEARVDARGQWETIGTSDRPIGLIVTAVIAGVALAGFAYYVPWLVERLR